MTNFLSLSELYNDITILKVLKNSSFYYISNKKFPSNNFTFYVFIINNNNYIHDFEFKPITDRFLFNKDDSNLILLNKDFTILELDKVIFIKFIHDNAGHALGNIMNTIYKLKDIDLSDYKIIITEDLINFSYFLTSVIYLFFDESQITIVNDKTLVNFNETYVIKDYSYKNEQSSNFLVNKLKLFDCMYDKNLIHKNIFLIKSCKTKNQYLNHRIFNNEYNEYLTEMGFKMIIPEDYDIRSLFHVINNASNIIMSWGCCSYLNSIFVNENANVLVLAHIGYEHEYTQIRDNYPGGIFKSAWFPEKCNKKQIAYCKTELDNNIKLELKKCISNMI